MKHLLLITDARTGLLRRRIFYVRCWDCDLKLGPFNGHVEAILAYDNARHRQCTGGLALLETKEAGR